MVSVSVCMIVRNEAGVLRRCLDSVRTFADEIVVVDTGSTDDTAAIAGTYTDRVYDFTWRNDFSAARNYAFGKGSGDFLMWLDADDCMEKEDGLRLMRFMQEAGETADYIAMPYLVNKDDRGNVLTQCLRNRLTRRSKGFAWQGLVHEYLAVGGNGAYCSVPVHHMRAARKPGRNLSIYKQYLQQGNPLSTRDLYYFANELKDNQCYGEAIAHYDKCIAKGDASAEERQSALLGKADCLLRRGREREAEAAALQSLKHGPPRAEPCCFVAHYYMTLKQWRKAIMWYEQAAALTLPEHDFAVVNVPCWTWLPHLQLAVCYERIGNGKQALRHIRKALEYDAGSPLLIRNKQLIERRFKNR